MAELITVFLDTQAAAPDWSANEYPSSVDLYLDSSIDASAGDSRENLKVSTRNRGIRSHD